MKLPVIRSQASICHLCEFIVGSWLLETPPPSSTVTPQGSRSTANLAYHSTRASDAKASGQQSLNLAGHKTGVADVVEKHDVQEVLAEGQRLLQEPVISDDEKIVAVQQFFYEVAEQLIDPHQPRIKMGESM